MRKLALALTAVAGLVAVYAAAGYWWAPRIVFAALQERAGELGATLVVKEVRTDPFALAVDLRGVELSGANGARVAGADAVHVDLAWASLWSDAWTVERARIERPYVNLSLPLAQKDSRGTATKPVAVRVDALSVSGGAVQLSYDGSELDVQDVSLEVQNFSTRGGSEAQYRFGARLAGGGTMQSQGTFSEEGARGKVAIAAVDVRRLWRLAGADGEAPQGQASAQSNYAYEQGRFVLRDLTVASPALSYAGIELAQTSAHAPEVAIPPKGPVQIQASARLRDGGSISAQGRLQAKPFAGVLEVEVQAVPLRLARRFLSDTAALDIAGGDASSKGTLRFGDRILYEGRAAVRGLKLQEHGADRLLLGWKLAQTDALKIALDPLVVELGEVRVQAPQGRIIIEQDGSVNVAAALRRGPQGGAKKLQASVRRLSIEGGTLEFADRSLATPFEAKIRDLAGTMSGFSTEAGDPALLQLAGRVQKYGDARIRGTITLDDPMTRADIRARFRNIDLAQLAPYVVKFAGYRVRSGRLSADLRYRMREGELLGENRLAFQQLQLGEKVERAGAADLPLQLAVALLTDAEGRINLDIPVSGNLNDPKFDFGGLVARALGNALGRIVSAPFRALAGLFGGRGDELGAVRFAPGSAELPPPEEENIAKVAQTLAARPQLGVSVRATYDPDRDVAALRATAARGEIERRAGYASKGPLDFTDPKVLVAAEKLYLERSGNRLELQALRESSPQYGRALVQALAAKLPAPAPEALARSRAEAVREALLDLGVDASRVALETPVAAAGEQDAVATQLSLTAGAGGAASVGTSALRVH